MMVSHLTETPVDATDELVNNSAKVLVFLNVLTAGHGDLHKNDFADPFWVFGEEDLQSMKLLRNAFDVVKTINTNDEFHALKLAFESGDTVLYFRLHQALVKLFGIDSDWKCSYSYNFSLKFNAVRCSDKATKMSPREAYNRGQETWDLQNSGAAA